MSYKYSYSSWWWTWRGPKHVEVINKIDKIYWGYCAPNWFHLQDYIKYFKINTYSSVTLLPILHCVFSGLMMLSVWQTKQHLMTGWITNSKHETILKHHGIIKILSWNLPGRTEESHQKDSRNRSQATSKYNSRASLLRQPV